MPTYLPWLLNGIAAILLVIGWRRDEPWIVYVAQAIAYIALALSLVSALI